MIRINLLPFRAARKKENVRRQVSIFLLSLLLVLILMGWIHFYLQGRQKTMVENVTEVKKELALYQEKNEEIKTIRAKLMDLERRQKVIVDLQAQRFEPVHILDSLTTKIVPERMWLTNLNLQQGQLALVGLAVDNHTVAAFLDNLATITTLDDPTKPMYEVVKLNKLQSEKVRDINLKKFDITALKNAPVEATPDNKQKTGNRK